MIRPRLATSFVSLLIIVSIGCASSHEPGSEPPGFPLIAVAAQGNEAVIHAVSLSAEEAPQRLAAIPLALGETPRVIIGNSRGTHGLIVAFGPEQTIPSAPSSLWIADWNRGEVFDVLGATQMSEGDFCRELSGPNAIDYEWRSDGNALVLRCTNRTLVSSGWRIQASRILLVNVDGTSRSLSEGCATDFFTTHDARVVVASSERCDDSASELLYVVSEGTSESVPLGEGETLHFWNPTEPGFLSSRTDVVDGSFDYHDVRWRSVDGETLRTVADHLPLETIWLPMSPNADLLVGHRSPPGSSVVESVSIMSPLGSVTDVQLPACTTAFGAPQRIHWAPDGSAFTFGCHDQTWIVDRSGVAQVIDVLAGEFDRWFSWHADSQHLIKEVRQVGDAEPAWRLVDRESGETRRLPALDHLEPTTVGWTRQPWAPPCGSLALCN